MKKYPHLSVEDTKIWNRFVEKYPNYYDAVSYDVRVGEGGKVEEQEIEAMKKDWKDLTRKRVDVIGYRNNDVDIIEIKPNASSWAIGQVMMYDKLFRLNKNVKGNVNKVIITDREINDTRKVCDALNIKLIVV